MDFFWVFRSKKILLEQLFLKNMRMYSHLKVCCQILGQVFHRMKCLALKEYGRFSSTEELFL